MKKKFFLALAVLSLATPTLLVQKVRADESVTNQAKDAAGNAKTDTKKTVRTAKRQVRKATGNDSVLKDAKDKANDAGDDISNGASKAGRKAGVND